MEHFGIFKDMTFVLTKRDFVDRHSVFFAIVDLLFLEKTDKRPVRP